MKICLESFPITGTYYGLFPKKSFNGLELKPAFRRNYFFREGGPVESEDTSHVVYEEFMYGYSTGRFYSVSKSNRYGWILEGKEVLSFAEQEYLSETEGPDVSTFNSNNTIKTVHYGLRGDEKSFVAINKGSYLYPEYELEQQ